MVTKDQDMKLDKEWMSWKLYKMKKNSNEGSDNQTKVGNVVKGEWKQ